MSTLFYYSISRNGIFLFFFQKIRNYFFNIHLFFFRAIFLIFSKETTESWRKERKRSVIVFEFNFLIFKKIHMFLFNTLYLQLPEMRSSLTPKNSFVQSILSSHRPFPNTLSTEKSHYFHIVLFSGQSYTRTIVITVTSFARRFPTLKRHPSVSVSIEVESPPPTCNFGIFTRD